MYDILRSPYFIVPISFIYFPAAVSKSMCGSQSEGTVYTINEPIGLDKIMILYITIPAIRMFNPSARGHLNPSSYCDVGRFFSGYLNFELNRAGVY